MRSDRRFLFVALFTCSLLVGCRGVTNNSGVIGCYDNRCVPTPVPTVSPTTTSP